MPSDVYGISNQARLDNINSTYVIISDAPILPGFSDPTVVFIKNNLAKKIKYSITIPDCDNQFNPVTLDEGTFEKGESFIFPP